MKQIKILPVVIVIIILFAAALAIKLWPKEEIQAPEEQTPSELITEYVEEPPVAEEPVQQAETPAAPKKPAENIIKLTEDKLEPVTLTVQRGSTVKWVSDDSKFHRISCYDQDNIRMAFSDILKKKGDSYKLTFMQNGEYLCMDAVFGLRGKVVVKENVFPITGAAVGAPNISSKDLTPLIFLLIIIAGVIIANKVVKKKTTAN